MHRWIMTVIAAGMLSHACSDTSIANTPPMAFAGFDAKVRVGEICRLDGSASSDPDGDGLTFHWTVESVPGAEIALANAETPTPEFVPEEEGLYVFGLVVSDGNYASFKDLVSMTAELETAQ